MFISKYYVSKVYPVLERQHAISRQMASVGEDYILPVRIDDTRLPDLPETIRYEDLRRTTIAELASLLKKKLEQQTQEDPKLETSLDVGSSAPKGPLQGATAREMGVRIIHLLADGDFRSVVDYIHPQKGVTLAIYANVGPVRYT